uniref:Retinoblastoma-associated protein B-box domain-containing protein n=1 Tax=Callorhinchus milii TaxID=7868 RepID=A0A4W3HYJ7_CALMI
MVGRHLDQLLLCAVYIMAKITKEDKSFTDIMKCYRSQPQASSHVYRSVLLKGGRRPDAEALGDEQMQEEPGCGDAAVQNGSRLCAEAGSCTGARLPTLAGEVEVERGDLIKFYNTIYVNRIKCFALKYSTLNLECGVRLQITCCIRKKFVNNNNITFTQ